MTTKRKLRKCLCCEKDGYILSDRELKYEIKTTFKHVDRSIKNHHWSTLKDNHPTKQHMNEIVARMWSKFG